MPPDELITETRLWLAYAQCDLDVARACSDRETVHGWAIAFHCQQTVEKALKGGLVLYGEIPPRTHHLVQLEEMLRIIGRAGPLAPIELELLTPFAINDKYPSLIVRPISRADAIALVESAQLAVQWLAGLLEF